MLRAMILEFPDDPTCRYLDTQYMLGPALLVAPIFSPAGEVSYYLPEGEWRNLLTGEDRPGTGLAQRKTQLFQPAAVGPYRTPCPVGMSVA